MLKRSISIALAIVLVGLLVLQARSLFVFPVPDSIRWFGDESWLMTESISTVKTGTVHHPHALSSTLNAPKAFLPVGAAWLRTAVYGVPGYLLYPAHNPIHVGRVVTWLLSLLLIGVTYWIVRRRTGDNTSGLTAAVILASTLSFFYSSHSSRPDLLKGLIILMVAAWVSSEGFVTRQTPRKWFVVTLVSLICAIWLPFHLYFHLISICGVAFLLYRGYRDRSAWMWILLGVFAALAITGIVQYTFSGELLLSGPEGHKAEFSDVTRDIPILRLLSLSAQLSVLQRRFEMLWTEAPLMFVLIPLAVYALWHYRRTISAHATSRMLAFAIAALLGWYFLQRIHPAYTIQILPLFIAASVIAFSRLRMSRTWSALGIALVILSAVITAIQSIPATANGRQWTEENNKAVQALRSLVETNGAEKPLVMVEASASMPLLSDTSIRLMTTHFQFFPIYDDSIGETIDRHDVDYCILFNTANYGYDRNAIDPLVRTIKQRSDLIGVEAGDFFDISKDYFKRDESSLKADTLFLYKLRK
ncbi:MAG TPA: hypothetical protein VFH43_09035 [Candidatus Kapabacteria bacterium]|nr:hypothetical protein [Candidatus Kapabacteria bacterium]